MARKSLNPKLLAAICIGTTSSAFELGAVFTLHLVPRIFSILGAVTGFITLILSVLAAVDFLRGHVPEHPRRAAIGDGASTLRIGA